MLICSRVLVILVAGIAFVSSASAAPGLLLPSSTKGGSASSAVLSVDRSSSAVRLDQLKMQRRFGVGVGFGGLYSVLGIDADVNLTENFSIGGGLGTGVDYSSFLVRGRYYLLGEWVSPYLSLAFGRWWTTGTPNGTVGPSVLANRFLDAGQDLRDGFSVYIVSPAVGVQYMNPMGFSVSFELQYLFKLFTFANGTYAGLTAHWYF